MMATTLDPELVAKVKALSPEQHDALFNAVFEVDVEPVVASQETLRRSEEIANGTAKLLTREEFDSSIKEIMKEQGLVL